MKKTLLTVACALFMFSCAQDDELFIEETTDMPVQTQLTTAEAQTKFAKILSKAVSNSEDVRRFLKEEAMTYFDNDNDVFYPFVKDKIVQGTGSRTFRNILLSYCDSEEELESIEKSQPLLNILVPDLTLFWDFNAEKWDTSDNEVAVFCRNDKTNSLYENGENIGQLPVGEIPGFPCLVIKNNERLRISNTATRTIDGIGYEFISDAYDGSKRKPQTRDSDFYHPLEETENLDKPISASEIPDYVIKAYQEFKNIPSACQRDYIYYGITKDNKPGNLNMNIREKLYRFRISENAFTVISDDEIRDPHLSGTFDREGSYYSDAELLQKIWTGGAFEFMFYSSITIEGSETGMDRSLHISCKPSDVYSLSQIHVHHKNSTLFRHSKNTYTTDARYLKSKWIYPEKLSNNTKENFVFTEPWNVYEKSLSIHMFISEIDEKGEDTIEKTVVSEYSNKADFSTDVTGGNDDVKFGAKLSYGFTSTHSSTSVVKYLRQVGSDELGTLTFHFYDPVITSQTNEGYKLYTVSSGDVQVTLLPSSIIK